jgi:hypothetical protein
MCEAITKCIYCNSDDLTVSDIIPFALTGAKVAKKFVCKKHNAHTNVEFERDVIDQWGYFRNNLGLRTRDGDVIKYRASLHIDDIVIENVTISSKKFFFTNKVQLFPADRNGQKLKVGHIDKLKQIRGSNPFLIDMKNAFEQYNFSLKELIISTKMKRTIAKISYEWHCLINGINGYDDTKYHNIVSYIIDGDASGVIDPVELVVDYYPNRVADECCEFGTNSLFEYIDAEGNNYVIFNFWNVIIYKTIVAEDQKKNTSTSEFVHLYKYNLDGTKSDYFFGIIGIINVMAEQSEKALDRLNGFYLDRLTKLLTVISLSLYKVKRMIDEMYTDFCLLQTKKIDIGDFLNYEDCERIIAIILTMKFKESRDCYNFKMGFNQILSIILNTNEYYRINEADKQKYIQTILAKEEDGTLQQSIYEGKEIFDRIFENEKQRIDNYGNQ